MKKLRNGRALVRRANREHRPDPVLTAGRREVARVQLAVTAAHELDEQANGVPALRVTDEVDGIFRAPNPPTREGTV